MNIIFTTRQSCCFLQGPERSIKMSLVYMEHVIHFQMENSGNISNFIYFQDKTSQLFTFKWHYVRFGFRKIKELKRVLLCQVFIFFPPSGIIQSASKKTRKPVSD